MQEQLIIKLSNDSQFTINKEDIIDRAICVKSDIMALEEELKQMEPVLLKISESCGDKLSGRIGEVTVCRTKTYEFSKKVVDLEQKKKEIEAKIKAQKIIEISQGVIIQSEKKHLRFNIEREKK